MIPERVRVNHRYRGPRESLKASHTQDSAARNLKQIEDKLNALAAELSAHKVNVLYRQAPSTVEKPIDSRIENLSNRIGYIERGI